VIGSFNSLWFLFIIFEAGAGNGFLQLTDVSHVTIALFIAFHSYSGETEDTTSSHNCKDYYCTLSSLMCAKSIEKLYGFRSGKQGGYNLLFIILMHRMVCGVTCYILLLKRTSVFL
jgi:hypothetical protein